MQYKNLLNPVALTIGALLAFFTIFSFILRTLPAWTGNTDVLMLVGMDDPTYQLRRIEQLIANYPSVSWFDPMTYFPAGQPMHWGPLFPFIGATVCILTGATTRPDLISVALFIPCVMGALMVPVIYALVTRIADWKAGIFAAFFIAIIPGQFFFRSFYGYLDHHIGEVLFSTIFCLCYLIALVYCRKHPVDIKDRETWKIPVLLGVLCGVTYVISLSLMPTMLLFALIVAIFTPVWFIFQRYIGHLGASALIINSVTFIVAIIGFFIIGVHGEGGLNYYTLGHPIAYGLIILANVVLFGFSYKLREKPYWYYVGAIVLVSLIGVILLAVLLPDLFSYLMANANAFFGEDIHWRTIQEARSWSFDDAWRTFQYSLLLFAAGVIILFYRIKKELCPSYAFTLLWALVIFFATCQHIRYEYYLAVPVAILSGIAVGFALDLIISGRKKKVKQPDASEDDRSKKKKTGGKHHEGQKSTLNYLKSKPLRNLSFIIALIILIFALLFSVQAVGRDAMVGYLSFNPDWKDTCEWLENNTPDTGMDYYAIYPEENLTLPSSAYGVMSWWDYGHIILFLGKRMPNANPFQYGVDGPFGAARYFMTQNESEANNILDHLKTKYVITDYEMDTGKFWAMSTWDNPDVGVYPYQQTFIFPNPENQKTGVNYPILTNQYYNTMISRLHNFDGSYTEAGKVYYLKYMKPEKSGFGAPFVVDGVQTNYTTGKALLEAFNQNQSNEYGATLANFGYTDPVEPVPALQHYRLVYESPTRTTPNDQPDIRYVKIFEYVEGAEIQGEGILELNVKTNTGREFVYRAESINGTFTVPYPTTTKIGAVEIPGKYRNVQTGTEYEVSEEQIETGARI